jgi:ubiquinone biosynthesis protein Coq4
MKSGTVGKEIANMLDEKGFKLIPKFKNHDLKHLVLGYQMTLEDEIRMQAYLIGNGNRTFWCLLFFSQAILMPELWRELLVEYKKGQSAKSIFDLTLDSCINKNLKELQRQYSSNYQTAANMGLA